MDTARLEGKLIELKSHLHGELYTDMVHRLIYATDASIFREVPLAVVYPKNSDDLRRIIRFAGENKIPVIPRAAGTSLAGQVVGNGIIVDISKHLTRIISLNTPEKWVEVEPGVVLDELNLFLQPHGLFFGPETSTSNRCMIAGMVGNNACGAHSIIYGSTREHLMSLKLILSDGSEAEFGPVSTETFAEKCEGNSLENKIYRHMREILSNPENQEEIRKNFPDPSVKRRNTGYAIDLLLETAPFGKSESPFNLSKLIAGSEGTLAFITSIKLNLVPLPPPVKGLVCPHFEKREDAFRANLIALKYAPGAVEMMDSMILNCTRDNIEQQKNRFFIEGDPAAVLIIEFAANTKQEIVDKIQSMQEEMTAAGLGYHFPRVFDSDIPKVWNLRKAGLGVLSNIKGDARPISLIEDTAVNPEVLPDYMAEFEKILKKYDKECVYHAHIGSGELHLRPVLNLRDPKDVEIAHHLGRDVAHLVKKYRGSLSGEHGDGRLRSEFISIVIGEKNYQLLRGIKEVFDPNFIFNPGKITDAPSIKENLRVVPGSSVREIETFFDFTSEGGIIRATEKCNGSGDCRKTEIIGGTMCPSYMASKDENTTTRARANLLREFLTNSKKKNPFDHKELYDILDLCLSCKACKSECPSSVDMAKLKSEFLQHYHDANGISLRTRLIANIGRLNQLASMVPSLFNFVVSNRLISGLIKQIAGFAKERSIPFVYKMTLRKWAKNNLTAITPSNPKSAVNLFVDEFTNYNDVETGIKALKLLSKLGYKVLIPDISESGRSYISKGFLRKARKIAVSNILKLQGSVNGETPLLGIEPSAILSFRDEYPELVPSEMRKQADKIAASAFMIDEFLLSEMEKGIIKKESFKTGKKKILLHGHCQQKAIASVNPTIKILSFPENYEAVEIKSGCCGMAGSFGYEKEHYKLSMKVGELVLFPAVKKAGKNTLIAATGTSCRHQIKDGTGSLAYHPVEILYDALI
jgi:FAD/FMN-containing dehydrogenase/Fe-S oxidoreductase